MKKTRLFASVLSLAIAGSLCLSVAACGDDDDPADPNAFGEVTSEQWTAAFSKSNFSNVKIVYVTTEKGKTDVASKATYIVAGDRQYFRGESDSVSESYAVKIDGEYTFYNKGTNQDGEEVWSKSEYTSEEGIADDVITSFSLYGMMYSAVKYDAEKQGYVPAGFMAAGMGDTVIRFRSGQLAEIYSEMPTSSSGVTIVMAATTTFTFGGQSITLPDEEGFVEDQFGEDEEEGGNSGGPVKSFYVGTWVTYQFTIKGGETYNVGDFVKEIGFTLTEDIMALEFTSDGVAYMADGGPMDYDFPGTWEEVEDGVTISFEGQPMTFTRSGNYLTLDTEPYIFVFAKGTLSGGSTGGGSGTVSPKPDPDTDSDVSEYVGMWQARQMIVDGKTYDLGDDVPGYGKLTQERMILKLDKTGLANCIEAGEFYEVKWTETKEGIMLYDGPKEKTLTYNGKWLEYEIDDGVYLLLYKTSDSTDTGNGNGSGTQPSPGDSDNSAYVGTWVTLRVVVEDIEYKVGDTLPDGEKLTEDFISFTLQSSGAASYTSLGDEGLGKWEPTKDGILFNDGKHDQALYYDGTYLTVNMGGYIIFLVKTSD